MFILHLQTCFRCCLHICSIVLTLKMFSIYRNISWYFQTCFLSRAGCWAPALGSGGKPPLWKGRRGRGWGGWRRWRRRGEEVVSGEMWGGCWGAAWKRSRTQEASEYRRWQVGKSSPPGVMGKEEQDTDWGSWDISGSFSSPTKPNQAKPHQTSPNPTKPPPASLGPTRNAGTAGDKVPQACLEPGAQAETGGGYSTCVLASAL